MSAISHFTQSNVLVIDDIASMRSQIVSNLSLLGFSNLWSVGSCEKALRQIAAKRFDLILCDYHLGEITSGQEFLEFLRAKNVIPLSTLFVMISARRSYEDVMRVAECAPDDYLVKPFTGAQLSARLAKLIEKRNRFSAVHAAMSKGDWTNVIKHCDPIIDAQDRFSMEATKTKGDALLKADRPDEAESLFRSVLESRPLGWAQLGLARALKAQREIRAAEGVLATLIAEGRKNRAADRMGAYDELADLLQATNRHKEAMTLIQDAMTVSPGSITRTRHLTKLAVREGEMELAEKTARQLINDHKHSQVKESSDYLMAVDVLTTAGHVDEALAAVKEARKSFSDDVDTHTLSVAEATACIAKGDTATATTLLQSLPPGAVSELTPLAAATLGKALYLMGDAENAAKVMRNVVQNNPDNADVIRTVHVAMAAAGQEANSQALVDSSIEEAAEINDEGVRLAYAGKLNEAVSLLSKAAELLPGNTQFVSNAALVIALSLSKGEIDPKLLQSCLKYRQMVATRAPNHPKLSQIDGLLNYIQGTGGTRNEQPNASARR
jgi:DNA-binding response OmpR family regulator/Flp pilus assembly protein TadD